jgi:basic amino acid/polyamine antiporter, APA family
MDNKGTKAGKLGLTTTVAFVIANMIGTGVFTSLGFQLSGIQNIVVVLSLWIVGGIIALCGSLVYSELGAAMPRSGGEYHYLSKIYHPYIGFLSGWVSITVGFAAPVALAAMALGKYSSQLLPGISPELIAVCVLILITLVHTYDIKLGGKFQNIFTSFKILLICGFILGGLVLIQHFQDFSMPFKTFSYKDFFSGSYATSLVYVSYAFSGWNASAYIAGEIKDPQKNIPKSLLFSTALVTILYFLLNFTFLLAAPVSDLKGQLEVGNIVATKIFGITGGNIMAGLISILLVSSISSFVFVGPRVSLTMGEDLPLFKFLSYKSKHNTPVLAIILQSSISFFMILTSSFNSILLYAGFTLNLFTFLTVLGVFVHRTKYKNTERPYKTWGYPVVPIVFLAVMLYTLVFLIREHPFESLMGLLTLFSGSIFYLLNWYFEKKVSTVKTN